MLIASKKIVKPTTLKSVIDICKMFFQNDPGRTPFSLHYSDIYWFFEQKSVFTSSKNNTKKQVNYFLITRDKQAFKKS